MAQGPWFRVYSELIDNKKVQSLPDKYFRWCLNLWCLSKLNGGPIGTVDFVAWRLRRRPAEAIDAINYLIKARLLERRPDGSCWPHDWQEHQFSSDSSTDRVKQFRERRTKQLCNVSLERYGNALEQNRTDTEQNRTEQNRADELFQRLYDRHPRKARRHLAEQALVSLIAPLPDAERGALLSAIEAGHASQFADPGGDYQFAPALDTWLLGHRWTDAPEPEQRRRGTSRETFADRQMRRAMEVTDEK